MGILLETPLVVFLVGRNGERLEVLAERRAARLPARLRRRRRRAPHRLGRERDPQQQEREEAAIRRVFDQRQQQMTATVVDLSANISMKLLTFATAHALPPASIVSRHVSLKKKAPNGLRRSALVYSGASSASLALPAALRLLATRLSL